MFIVGVLSLLFPAPETVQLAGEGPGMTLSAGTGVLLALVIGLIMMAAGLWGGRHG